MPVLEGYMIGLTMIIFVGPVFFLLLSSSFQHGVKAGVSVALGIIISDLVCIILCYYGVSSFMTTPQNQFWIGITGSSILFILSILYLFKKASIKKKEIIKSRKFGMLFLKGFAINFFNPFVFIVWIVIYNYAQHQYVNKELVLLFLASVLMGIVTTDLLKVFLSEKIERLITEKRLHIFFKITGVILLIFAIRLLYIVL